MLQTSCETIAGSYLSYDFVAALFYAPKYKLYSSGMIAGNFLNGCPAIAVISYGPWILLQLPAFLSPGRLRTRPRYLAQSSEMVGHDPPFVLSCCHESGPRGAARSRNNQACDHNQGSIASHDNGRTAIHKAACNHSAILNLSSCLYTRTSTETALELMSGEDFELFL